MTVSALRFLGELVAAFIILIGLPYALLWAGYILGVQ